MVTEIVIGDWLCTGPAYVLRKILGRRLGADYYRNSTTQRLEALCRRWGQSRERYMWRRIAVHPSCYSICVENYVENLAFIILLIVLLQPELTNTVDR
jgi:hypothetical protein